MKKTAPFVPPSHWFLRNFNRLAKDPLNFMSSSAERYGGLVNLNISPWVDLFLITDPDIVKYVLVDNQRNYKKSFAYKILKYPLGNGLLTNEGESWLKQRRIAQPAFHRERLNALTSGMVGPVNDLMEVWAQVATEGRIIDVSSDFMKLTTEIAAKAMFSTNMGTLKDEITDNITIVNHFVMDKVSTPFRIPVWLPVPSNLNFKKALKKLDEIIYELIENRRKSKQMPHDLLTMLIEAEDEETGEKMNNEQLRDELMTLFLAGSETSSNTLTWTIYLLSQHPDVSSRLYGEVKKELGNETPSAENIMKLKYTALVIQEAMRLYPPAWVIGREPLADDEINGVKIKKGSQVYVSTFVIHRSDQFYSDPLKFDPLRFAPEKVKARPKFSYLPFGAGPRLCIGNNFAMMEVTIALASIAQKNFLFELQNKNVAMEPLVTLRPKGGLLMKISNGS